VSEELPIAVMDKVARIPGIGSTQFHKDVRRLGNITQKMKSLVDLFAHFTLY
jgi:hypothetical protein